MSSDGQITNLTLKPGVYKNTTELKAEGRYVDADKVRWFYGNPQKIGGWVNEQVQNVENASITTFAGVARDILAWESYDGTKQYLGVATNEKVEVFWSGQIYDITPIRVITTVTNGISTSTGSNLVRVCVNANAAELDDWVVLGSVAASIGGLTLSGQYQIVSVSSANTFYIESPVAATNTSTAAGGSATFSFLINTGNKDDEAAGGWGSGGYGRGGYGTPLSGGKGMVAADEWSLQNWGQDLMACRRGGPIYHWLESQGLTSTLIDRSDVRMNVVATAAPSQNNLILVSFPSEYLISFGCTDLTSVFDPLMVRWSNQGDYTTWDPTVSVFNGNSSGFQGLQGGSRIVGVIQTRGEILIFTEDPVFIMSYSGDPFWFSFNQIGDHAGLISQHAAIDMQGIVYWMGNGDFHMYNGLTQTINCDIQNVLFKPGNKESINFDQADKIFAGHNSAFNELIWFYPAADSLECNRYIIYNYLEGTWYDGTMDRTVWLDVGIFKKPYAIDAEGTLFVQETGTDDGSNAMPFYYETSFFDMQSGTDFIFVDKVIPDFNNIPNGSQLELFVTTQRYPQDPNPVTKGPYFIQNNTSKISLRARGRQVKYQIQSSAQGSDFEMGTFKMQSRPDGQR